MLSLLRGMLLQHGQHGRCSWLGLVLLVKGQRMAVLRGAALPRQPRERIGKTLAAEHANVHACVRHRPSNGWQKRCTSKCWSTIRTQLSKLVHTPGFARQARSIAA